MKRIRLLCCAGCFLLPSPGLTQTAPKDGTGLTAEDYKDWSVFADARVGFQLPVPPGMKAAKDAAPGRFTSEDGALVIAVWGGTSATPARIMEWQWKQAGSVAGRSFSVRRKDPAGFVISATDPGGAKFFQKFIIRGDRLATFTLTCSQSHIQDFGALVSKIEAAFCISSSLPDPTRAFGFVPKVPENVSPDQTEDVDLTPPPPSSDQKELAKYIAKGQRAAVDRIIEESRANRNAASDVGGSPKPQSQKTREIPVKTGPAVDGIPVALPVPGQPGFVYSPFAKNKIIDAVDIPCGTKVRCPCTGKIFRTPAQSAE